MSHQEKRRVDRKYSSVARSIWNHPKFQALEKPKPNARELLFRLLIAPESTSIPGLFQAWSGGLANALGWSERVLLNKFEKLEEQGWVKADWKCGLVWVPGAVEQDGNQPANPNVIRSWKGPISELPDCDLKVEALRELVAWAQSKGESWAKALDEALGKRKPMPSPNPSGKAQPKALVKTLPKQEAGAGTRAGSQKQEGPPGGRAQKFHERSRPPGEPPLPRKDIMGDRFAFNAWFPSQQWLDWAKESGISDRLFDKTLVEARDKLTGVHDVEWWDIKILAFFESALRRSDKSAVTVSTAQVVSE